MKNKSLDWLPGLLITLTSAFMLVERFSSYQRHPGKDGKEFIIVTALTMLVGVAIIFKSRARSRRSDQA
jgi:hypothetical protein